jgi:signal peptidase I
MAKKETTPPNPETRRKQYFWGGLALFALGWVFCLLNITLDVPHYQKVSLFTVFFLIVGGGLAAISGVEPPEEGQGEEGGKLWAHLWKVVTLLVLLSFGLIIADMAQSPYTESITRLLVFALLGAYFIFLYLVRLKPDEGGSRAKHLETAEVLIVAITLAIGIKAVGVQAFKIPSGSMLHTLEIGDHLLVSKFTFGVPLPYTDARLPGLREPERGDIIVFAYPGMDNPDRPAGNRPGLPDRLKEQDFIKRIIGQPGETIELRNNKLYIDGKPSEDPWGQFLDDIGRPMDLNSRFGMRLGNYGPAKVPEGMYLVMGDNRYHSNDGRVWGFVRKGRIKGNALFIYWSMPQYSRIGTIIK